MCALFNSGFWSHKYGFSVVFNLLYKGMFGIMNNGAVYGVPSQKGPAREDTHENGIVMLREKLAFWRSSRHLIPSTGVPVVIFSAPEQYTYR